MNINETWRESIMSTMLSPGPESYGEDFMSGLITQLGLVSVRASVLDRYSLVVLKNWSLNAEKDEQAGATEAGQDSSFIASRDVDFNLRDAKAEHTIVRKLSPRLWSFTWLTGIDRLIFVEARYLEPRRALDDKEAALIRLLFLNLAQKDALTSGQLESDVSENTWSSAEGQRGFGWRSLVLLLLTVSSALLAGWLAIFALPAASDEQLARQAETSRLQAMADQTVIQHLSSALAAGDYGDLQEELSGFHALGYYPRAIVLNASKRVVASVGVGNEARIGDAAPEALAASVRSVALTRGTEELGRFIYPERTVRAEPKSLSTLRVFAAASALAAIGAALFFLLFLRRR